MRVLHVLNLLLPGGVERLRASLVERTAHRIEHRILCKEVVDADYADHFRALGVVVEETGAPPSLLHPARYVTASRVVRQWRPDIVHGAVIDGYTLGAVAGRVGGAGRRGPVVLLEETSDPTGRSWRGDLLTKASARLSTHAVAVSPAVARYLTDDIGMAPDRVTILPNGVEQPAVLDPAGTVALRAELGIDADARVVGSVGRMHDESVKRFGDLIEAVAHLPRDVVLLLVGDGPERTGLAARAKDLGMADRVVFAGFREDVGPFYGCMDVFALASGREAFGMVLAEAMLAGLPTVATRVGGIPDVVEDGITGHLVAPRRPAELAAALRRVLDDPAEAARLGAAGRERAGARFTADRYVADLVALYERLLSGR